MRPDLSILFCWLRTNEQSIAIWLEGVALVAIFVLELKEYKRQGRERIEQQRESVAQMAIMQSQADAAKDAAEAAKDNAEAARLSAQAVLNGERAWVEIKLEPPLPPDYRDPNQDNSSDVFECSIQIENHGRTIARIETVQIGVDCLSGQFSEEPLNSKIDNLHSILGSGQKEIVGGFTAHSFLEWREILDGTKQGFLRIKVKYRDAVGTSTRHETSVVYIFQGSVEDEPKKISSLSVYT